MLRLCLLSVVVFGRTANAEDEFEIQVYDIETARQGDPGLEVHVNEHLFHDAPDATHVTFEPHYGLRDWLELGGYLQFAMDTNGDFEFAGAKLRVKARWPRRIWDDRIGLAFNIEISRVPAEFEANVWGSELRPIADLRTGCIYAAINPIIDVDLHGALAGQPQFEPAAKLGVVVGKLMFGTEAYGSFGTVGHFGSDSAEQVYAIIDVKGTWWDLNAGVGASWGTPDHPIAKLIFGMHPR